jgi:hypothetical protein
MQKLVTLFFLMGLTALPGWSNNCKVIDDLTTGPTVMDLRVAGTGSDTNAQTGSMIGGLRYIHFLTYANPFLQLGEAKVGNGALTVSNGVREFFRLEVFWGVDAKNNIVPLGSSPSGCDRFRVTFDSNSGIVNFNVQVDTPLALYQDGINLPVGSATGPPFCVDFPFSNFVSNTPGVKPDFAAQGISWMDMVLQSGPVIGANNFAITKIETLDSVAAAAAPCAFTAKY